MSNREAIFIFTKDRPETLAQTLLSIQKAPYPKFVIDDSVSRNNQAKIWQLCDKKMNCKYLGKDTFRLFCMSHTIIFPKFNFLLRSLGTGVWNLGYARNFALLYSKAENFEKVLFMDDDIQVPNQNLISDLFQLLNKFKFTGANVEGLVDDSALGHIATDVEVINERMLSGGFMVYNPKTVDHFFLNNYNEDWIWLFLQLKNDKHLQNRKSISGVKRPTF